MFSVADIGAGQEVGNPSDGDLWPSARADDGDLYSACSDGLGFDLRGEWSDIVVNRITGDPGQGLSGARLAAGDAVAHVWGDPIRYNRKPTRMVAVDGNGDGHDELYLAVQDLRIHSAESNAAFNDAPAAEGVRGRTRSQRAHVL